MSGAAVAVTVKIAEDVAQTHIDTQQINGAREQGSQLKVLKCFLARSFKLRLRAFANSRKSSNGVGNYWVCG
eukprot:5789306-Amphidinium_carterae.1